MLATQCCQFTPPPPFLPSTHLLAILTGMFPFPISKNKYFHSVFFWALRANSPDPGCHPQCPWKGQHRTFLLSNCVLQCQHGSFSWLCSSLLFAKWKSRQSHRVFQEGPSCRAAHGPPAGQIDMKATTATDKECEPRPSQTLGLPQ